MREVHAWRCKEGHVMGHVVRNGSGMQQLLVYRQAIDLRDAPSLNPRVPAPSLEAQAREGEGNTLPDVMMVAVGQVLDIRCSICGRMRTWVPGRETVKRMVAEMQRVMRDEE